MRLMILRMMATGSLSGVSILAAQQVERMGGSAGNLAPLQRVRAQPQGAPQAGALGGKLPATAPDRPLPRGSLLDLSV